MAKKLKNKKKFTNLIIIDASGSMQSKLFEVRGGIKQLFTTIKEDALKNPDVESTTVVVDFSSAGDVNVLVNTTDASELTDAIADAYSTRGMTALYDAIGKGFSLIPKGQDGVFVNILTDGEENDSKEFNTESVKKLIESAKSKNWAVTFMGTTEQCLNNAVKLGISKGNTVKFADTGAGVAFASATTATTRGYYYTSVVNGTQLDLDNIVDTVLNTTIKTDK